MKKNIASALAVVILCAAPAYAFFFFARGVARAVAIREAIAARRRDLAEEEILQSAASERSNARGVDLERIRGFFVNRQEPIDFVERLEAIAAKTGTGIALEVDESSGSDDIIFRITLEGTRASVARFVRALESAPYLVRVEEMNFQSVRADMAPNPVFQGDGARLFLAVRVRTR